MKYALCALLWFVWFWYRWIIPIFYRALRWHRDNEAMFKCQWSKSEWYRWHELNENGWYNLHNTKHYKTLYIIHGVYCTSVSTPPIARFMGPTWGPSGADRTQVDPMLVPLTLLSGTWSANKRSLTSLTASTKRKEQCDDIFVNECTRSCHFDNFGYGHWRKFRQNQNTSVSKLGFKL